jgi:iron complex outermembrane recepter protein
VNSVRIILLVFLALPAVLAGSPISGRVIGPDGRGVPNATITVVNGNGRQVIHSDSEGRFAFEASSDPTILIEAPAFRARRITAGTGVPLEVILEVAPHSEVITVTATRSPTRIADAPASVVVLSSEALKNSAAPTLDDALREVPGFALFRRTGSRVANPTAQGVSLRGIGASGASRAAVLDDGVPLNDPFGGWVYWGRVPRAAVDRVEVVRGGASDLYGSAAMGGVIQLLRRDEPSAPLILDASAGSEETAVISLFTAASRGKWRGSLAGDYFSTSGYVLVPAAERGTVDRNADSAHRALDGSVEHGTGEAMRLFLRGSLFDEKRNNGTPLQVNDTDIRQLAAGIDQTLSTGAVLVRGWAARERYHQTFSAIGADRESERLTIDQRVPTRSSGGSAQWAGGLGRHSLVTGAEFRQVRGSSDEQQFAARGTTLLSSGGTQRALAVFAEDALTLGTRATLSGGLRYDGWRNFDAARLTIPPAPQPATRVELASHSESALSPRLALLVRVGEGLTATASAYRAFRAPTLNELYRGFRVGNVVTDANEELRAERLTGSELGVRVTPAGSRASLRATLFLMTTEETIANVTISSTPTLISRQRQNLGASRSRGVEIDGDEALSDRWTLSGGYLLSDSVVTDSPGNRALEGLRVPQVPRHQATLQLRSTPSVNANSWWSRLTLGIQGRWTGAQFEDDQNQLPLGRFVVVDGFAAWPLTRRLDLTLAVENLFDEQYQAGRTPVPTLGQPRTVRAGVRVGSAGR